jgi:hypothetical protein
MYSSVVNADPKKLSIISEGDEKSGAASSLKEL